MPCPDANTLVRMMEGQLPQGACAEVEAHLDVCPLCASVVAAVAQQKGDASGLRHSVGAAPAKQEVHPEGQTLHTSGVTVFAPPTPSVAPPPPPASASAEEDAVPPVLGRYRLNARLGEGAMGMVFAAYDPMLDRPVALKLLRARWLAQDPHATERLVREARAMARLTHPHVVAVYDAGHVQGRFFVAMEYVVGSTLTQWLAAAPRSSEEKLRVLCEAGAGLAAAHDVGLVHRDFKPDNVLVDSAGRAKVADFGLAYALAGVARGEGSVGDVAPDSSRTEAGALVGTPAFMAPEQWLGNAVGPAADQYAFCLVAYELLFGVRPFGGASPRERLGKMISGVPEVPASFGDATWVLPLLLRGLSARPEERFPSMHALLDALRGDTEKRLDARCASQRKALLGMSALHYALLAFVLLVRLFPGPGTSPAQEEAPGIILTIFYFFFAIAVLASLFWVPAGALWAPLNAWGFRHKKTWVFRSTKAYAWCAVFSGVGLPYGLWALYGLGRPGMREYLTTGRVPWGVRE